MKKPAPHACRGFALRIVGYSLGETLINHRTASRAKTEFYHANDGDVPFTAIRVRVLGAPVDTPSLRRVRHNRGRPELLPGVRVRVGETHALGVIVDGNYSDNFDVLFDDDGEVHPGLTLNVHPSDIVLAENPCSKSS